FVGGMGLKDDVGWVLGFFAVNAIEKPDGTTTPFQAHEYGVLVLAYSHLDGFFSPADEPAAEEALRLWLWEQPDAAQKSAQRLSLEGQKEFDRLVPHPGQVQPKLPYATAAHKKQT